jgi:2-oxoisovalerate dehydrogenase E2 component (dihydrolipoyl transacylase)
MSDIKDFKLPDLGEGLEEGEIVAWHVAVGDQIELNDTVADIETAKAVVAVPSPFAGRVVELIGDEGATIEVGAVFVRIDTAVDGGSAGAGEVDEPHHTGEASPAQGGFESGVEAADASVPDADAETTPAVAADKRPSTGLDADEEPQPLVGYGQGKAGGARSRRRRGGASAEASGNGQNATEPPARPLAKPPVRKLAKDLGVDLAVIAPGSGTGGVITRDDVQAAADGGGRDDAGADTGVSHVAGSTAAATAAALAGGGAAAGASTADAVAAGSSPGDAPMPELHVAAAGEKAVPGFRGRHPGEVEQIRGIRKRIVEKMELSRREIPEATCSRDADVTRLWEVRKELTALARDEGFDVKITPFVLVMRAAILGLRRFPTLNARIERSDADGDAGQLHLLEHINLGFAADTDRGLMVPNIKDAHTLSTLQLALALNELAGQARDGSIGPGVLTGGTFTVNNYGAFGNDDGDPIINHPEGAILGVSAMRERPWVVTGADGSSEIAVRRVARFTLAFDHRICDGGEAGRFVTYVADLCEQPERLLLHL